MKKRKKLTFHLCVHHPSGIILEMSLQEKCLRITKGKGHNLVTIKVGEIEEALNHLRSHQYGIEDNTKNCCV